jgi:hypothetical protein
MALPDLGKQIGPLPLGAWVAVVGGGLAIAYASRRADSGDEPIIVTDTSGDLGVGVGGYGAWTPTDGGSLTGPIADGGEITSNTQWGNQAFTFLVAMGNDAAVVDKAIRDYLSGIKLNMQANAMISLALAKLGQPPEMLPDAPVIPTRPPAPSPSKPPVKKPPTVKKPAPKKPTPKKPPGRKPPHVRTATVRPGDSLWKIAARAYGNPLRWREIYNANKSKIGSNPDRISVGMVLIIP